MYASTSTGIAQVDLSTGAVTPLLESLSTCSGLTWSPDGEGLIVVEHDPGRLVYYDLATGASSWLYSGTDSLWEADTNHPADQDGDGSFSYFVGGDDCDDEDESVYPGSGCE